MRRPGRSGRSYRSIWTRSTSCIARRFADPPRRSSSTRSEPAPTSSRSSRWSPSRATGACWGTSWSAASVSSRIQPAVERRDALALAPLAVLPPHAGRGIGSALMQEVLAAADQRDEALIAVLGPPSFYRRFGFGPAEALGVQSPYDSAGGAYQVRPDRRACRGPGKRHLSADVRGWLPLLAPATRSAVSAAGSAVVRLTWARRFRVAAMVVRRTRQRGGRRRR